MNFVFLSPNFPKTYYNFTACLRKNGVTTLGIGDEPYDQLSQECRDSLVEYYKVSSLENYDEVYRAVAFFAFMARFETEEQAISFADYVMKKKEG